MKKIYTLGAACLLWAGVSQGQNPICLKYYQAASLNSLKPSDIEAIDLNNDGIKDLVYTKNLGTTNQGFNVEMGLGNGTFTNSVNYATGSNCYELVVADFNNDGIKDVITSNSSSSSCSYFQGTSTGSFVAATTISGIGGSPKDIEVGDFNSDGNMDFVIVNYYNFGNGFKVYTGNGAGVFTQYFQVSQPPIGQAIPVDGVTTGDYNGDSKSDLVVVRGSSSFIYINDGVGGFNAPTSTPYNAYNVQSVDVDNDSDLDLVSWGGALFVNTNNGSGIFTAAGSYTVPSSFIGYGGFTMGDFNGDGLIDAVAAMGNNQSGNLFVLRNTGGGVFVGSDPSVAAGIDPMYVCSGDFNGDSKLDVAVNNQYFGSRVVALNGFYMGPTNVGSCPGKNYTITPTGTTSYTFTNGGPIVNPTVTTTYSVIGTNSVGCVSDFYLTVNMLAPPLYTLSVSNTLICSGQSATISIATTNTATQIGILNNFNTAVVTPTTTSTYTAFANNTISGCQNLDVVTINVSTCTGIEETTNNNLVSIYPNPANDFMTIAVTELVEVADATTIYIINALGEIVLTEKVTSSNTTLNTSNLTSGIYFVKIESKNSSAIKKFMKQ
jgi:hypothetical protein